jgi:ABC-type nitrate/sulfonate/bicarbonate transport system permease component
VKLLSALLIPFFNHSSGCIFPKAMIPADPKFYLHFVILLMLTAALAVVGGNNGISLGKLIRRNDWLTRSTIRLLRLGMWLPIFLLWSYPSSFLYKPAIFQMLPFLKWTGSAPLLVSTIAGSLATITVFFGSCYYYLARRHLGSRFHASHDRLHLRRDIFFLALLVCLLWQNSYGNGWPYRWIFGAVMRGESNRFSNLFLYITVISWLAMFLLMIVVFVSNRVFRWSLDGAADSRRNLLSVELQNTNLRSLLGASLSAVVALLLWQLLNQPLETYLLIPRPGEVLQATISLLTSEGSSLWPDTRVSLLVILGGILWAGLFATPLVELCYRSGFRRCGGLLALSCLSPVVLRDAAILWLGMGAMRMAFSVSCFAFFPLVLGLWSYRQLSLPARVLVSIDEALPYAFLGMLTNETYSSTQGLGFFIATAASTLQTAKAFAVSLFLFGLLAALSGILRWMIKRAIIRSANATAVFQRKKTSAKPLSHAIYPMLHRGINISRRSDARSPY